MNAALKVPTIFSAIDKITGPVQKMASSISSFASTSQASFARAERGTRSFLKSAQSIEDKIFNLQNAAAVLFAGWAARKGFELVTNAAETADEIQKMSSVLGLSTKSFQELQFAAMRENVSSELLTNSFTKMNKSVGELQQGHGQLYSALSKNNPALLKQLKNTKSSEEAFNLLSAAVQKAPNALQKASIAASAFGRGGVEMIKLIEIGPDGIQKLRDEAQKLGIVMGDKMIQNAAEFADANDNMKVALKGLGFTIAGGLLPIMQKSIERITTWTMNNREMIKEKSAEFFNKIAKAAEWVYTNFDTIVTVGKDVLLLLATAKILTTAAEIAMVSFKIATFAVSAAQWIYTTALVASGTAQSTSTAMTVAAEIMYGLYVVAVVAATAAQWALNVALNANPIGLVIIAIAALIALVVVIVKKWNDWGAALSIFLGPLGLVISLFQSFRRNWDMVVNAFKTEGILGGLKAIGKVFLDALIMPLQQALGLIAKLTGAKWAVNAVADLQALRNAIGVNTTSDENGKSLVPAINTKRTIEESRSTSEISKTQFLTIDFKNMPKGVEAVGNGNGALLPGLTPTFGF